MNNIEEYYGNKEEANQEENGNEEKITETSEQKTENETPKENNNVDEKGAKSEQIETKENVEAKKEETKEIIEPKKEETKENAETKQEETDQKKISKKIIEFNPSLLTLFENITDDKREDELKALDLVAKFLNENAIGFFNTELSSAPNSIPVDMESLVDLMHKYGINVRYLGRIHSTFDHKSQAHIAKLFERVILVRALRKHLREIAIELPKNDLLTVVVQALNIFLGDNDVRAFVDAKITSVSKRTNGSIPANDNDKKDNEKSKKAKNKKKKAFTKQNTTAEETNKQLLVSSTELFNIVVKIAAERYSLSVKDIKSFDDFSCLKQHKDKLAFLREFCRAFGINLAPRTYSFSSNKSGLEYPVKLRDITFIRMKVKSASFYLEGLKYNYKAAENEIGAKNFDNAQGILRGCQSLVLNTYGIYNSDFVFITSKLATIAFLKNQVEEAIKTQLFVVQLCEKIYGIDHFNTAFAILELSNYFYEAKKVEESISLHTFALHIFDLVGGYINPSSLLCLHELQVLHGQNKNLTSSAKVLQELLKRNEVVFGETDERLSFLLGKLAMLKSEMGDLKEASILQARQSFILKKILKSSQLDGNQRLKQIFEEKIQESDKTKELFVKKLKEIENSEGFDVKSPVEFEENKTSAKKKRANKKSITRFKL